MHGSTTLENPYFEMMGQFSNFKLCVCVVIIYASGWIYETVYDRVVMIVSIPKILEYDSFSLTFISFSLFVLVEHCVSLRTHSIL